MPQTNDPNGKAARLKEQIDQGLDELGAALDAGRSEQLVAFLDCLSRFHRYSFGNLILIMMQRPSSTRVAGFQAWKKLNRHVRKGEKGISILAPILPRRKKSQDGEAATDDNDDTTESVRRVIGYRVVHVFDVSQTDGERLPEFARVSGDPGELVDRMRAFIAGLGINLKTDHIAGGADGVSKGGEIVIRPGLSAAETMAIMAHEAAHELLHKSARRQETTKTIRETEAEAVAFAVTRAIGLETGTSASDYIQLYNGSRETLQESMQHIRDCAAQILKGLLNCGPEPASA